MDAFLLALILTFVIAFGGREQLIIAQFSDALDRNVPLLIIGALCAAATAVVMAYAGSTMAAILPRRAAEMLVAFALLAGAVELAWPVKIKPMKEPTRSYVAIGAVLVFRQMGDAARFAIFALAAWAVFPTTALIGGALAGVAAVTLGWSLGLATLRKAPLRTIRLVLAICTGAAGLVIGLNARFQFL
jgi:putative Ca2+/H+ antiporter (TMEM165/GDT1 family)